MGKEENKEVVRTIEERWAKGDISVFDELAADNFVGHILGKNGRDIDKAGMKRTIELGRVAFTDYVIEIIDMIAEGEKVVVMKKHEYISTGEFLSIPPTGKKVSTIYMFVYRLENGKVAEVWGLEDSLGLYQQMGVLPSNPEFIQAYKDSH